MKLLFIYFNKDYRPRTILSMSILDTILKNEGHTTEIFDTSFYAEFLDLQGRHLVSTGFHKTAKNLKVRPKTTSAYYDLKRTVEEFKPDLIGFSYYTLNEDIQSALLVPLKRDFPNVKVIAGGPAVGRTGGIPLLLFHLSPGQCPDRWTDRY